MTYQFNNCEELVALCNKHKKSISEIAILREMELFNKKKPWVRNKMKIVRDTMWEAIRAGRKNSKPSKYGFIDGDARKIYKGLRKMKRLIHSKTTVRAMSYAIATTEQNARMGTIVAFPTAGGAGVVPGVLFSASEHMKSSKRKMLNALFTASAIGIGILKHGGSFSAAKAGCQAEIGVGTAMAAAGLTEMRGGTPEECINASALALKSMLGLACDPLGGLVEVPCVKRNAMGASIAISASDMTIIGVGSKVPMDEVTEAMMDVACKMDVGIRETALGGLAITKTGLALREKMGLPKVPKKYLKNCKTCKKCK